MLSRRFGGLKPRPKSAVSDKGFEGRPVSVDQVVGLLTPSDGLDPANRREHRSKFRSLANANYSERMLIGNCSRRIYPIRKSYPVIATITDVCPCAENSIVIVFSLLASAARVSRNGSLGTLIGGKARFPGREGPLVSPCRDTLSTPSQPRMSLQSEAGAMLRLASLAWT